MSSRRGRFWPRRGGRGELASGAGRLLSWTMFKHLPAALIAFLLAAPASASVPGPSAVTEAEMMRHIEVLASDAFEGRAPATAGERRTTDYIIAELQRRRVQPGRADGSWLQPVALVERRPGSHHVSWRANGRRIAAEQGRIGLVAREGRARIVDAP